MKIYTKTGDNGTTLLFGGRRVLKSDPQIMAYGSVDELSSFIGLLIEKVSPSDKQFLTDIQNGLYVIMSLLSGAPENNNSLEQDIKKIEDRIDEIEEKLPMLNRFILPQGGGTSSLAHVTRTVCRRVERDIVFLFSQSTINSQQSTILKYLNRLSDFFFVLARFYNKKEVFASK